MIDTFENIYNALAQYLKSCEFDVWYFDTIVEKPEGDRQETDEKVFKYEYVKYEYGFDSDYTGYIFLPYKDKYLRCWFKS